MTQVVARELACLARAKLSPTVSNMSVAELRGYVRTRVAREARELVRRSTWKVRMSASNEAELTAAAIERAIHLIVRDFIASPIATLPTPHIQAWAA